MATNRTLLEKIRVPGLVEGAFPPAPHLSLPDSIKLVTDFLRAGNGKTCIMTGAGVSVDSGIRAYRGPQGTYTIRKHRPIFYGEFIAEEKHRRRYWARSYLGYPPVRVAESNPTHYAMAALMKMGYVSSIITQNVDGLHHKSHSSNLTTYLSPPTVAPPTAPDAPLPPLDPPILELHGTLRHAHCLSCHTPTGRDAFQDRLSRLNPAWQEYSDSVQTGQREEKLNPDGDIELGPNVKYEDFRVPACDHCGGPMKPRVTFFGESLEPVVRRQSEKLVNEAEQLLVVGSSLATFSAYRLVRQAKEEGKQVGLVNVGETRGDPLVDWRVGWEGGAGPVFTGAIQELVEQERRKPIRDEVERLMKSGKIKKLPPSMRAAS
ncbi:uncharacterized protein JCM15063_001942 [Sporobolomyces koalae]|uniref:uncharacterized protein n=1 Tax=Sporobolomyces koalae TaxID=500713 RepID=UPI00317164D0